jgi:DNA integrity scanning protein DisA with diadenylate cyclase activity
MRITDLLDIVLVAAVFHVLIAWLRLSLPRGVARRSLVAAPLTAVVYLLAHVYDLYLLQRVLDGLLLALLVAGVVVYQSDIRRLLERAFTGKAPRRPQAPLVDTLSAAVTHMASKRMGALIAVRGHESWSAHIRGGVELGGAISEPLLYSIFHTSTPGHDGAVLIDDGRITRFAVHLPLASDMPDVSAHGGTRHTAALGLSQEGDAFVIVVSEERGTISIASTLTTTRPAKTSAMRFDDEADIIR